MMESVSTPLSKRFPGGVPIHQGEELSNREPIRQAPLLELYQVVLQQHIGAPPKPIVKKGDEVKKGQLLAEPGGFVSSPTHSPTSGKIKDFIEIPGPMGAKVAAVVIEADGEDAWGSELEPIEDWRAADAGVLRDRVGDAGIVGMGGASFPTKVKLSPPPEKKIDALILNGAECEPYLTADDRLMMENPAKVLEGAAIMAKILGVDKIFVGIEDNKKNALDCLKKISDEYGVKVQELPVRYPQGAEKQLIYALTGRKVPAGGLPMDCGCVVQNVGSCAAMADAVKQGWPLIERTTTVTGEPVVDPGNWRFKIGTPIHKALEWAGGVKYPPAKLILGGPMMGFAQSSIEVTVMKNTSGILLLGPEMVSQYESGACIRCGRCVDVCPMNLMPGSLSVMGENERFELMEGHHAMDCMECGSCAFVCPAGRPLVQHLRRGKGEIAAKRRKAMK